MLSIFFSAKEIERRSPTAWASWTSQAQPPASKAQPAPYRPNPSPASPTPSSSRSLSISSLTPPSSSPRSPLLPPTHTHRPIPISLSSPPSRCLPQRKREEQSLAADPLVEAMAAAPRLLASAPGSLLPPAPLPGRIRRRLGLLRAPGRVLCIASRRRCSDRVVPDPHGPGLAGSASHRRESVPDGLRPPCRRPRQVPPRLCFPFVFRSSSARCLARVSALTLAERAPTGLLQPLGSPPPIRAMAHDEQPLQPFSCTLLAQPDSAHVMFFSRPTNLLFNQRTAVFQKKPLEFLHIITYQPCIGSK